MGQNISEKEYIFMFELLYKANTCSEIKTFSMSVLNDIRVLIPYSQGVIATARRENNKIIAKHRGEIDFSWDRIKIFEEGDYDNDAYYSCFYPENKTTVFRDTEMRNEREFLNSRVYKDIFSAYNLFYGLRATLVYNNAMVGYIVMLNTKDKGDFTDKDKKILSILADNLALAFGKLQNKNENNTEPPSHEIQDLMAGFDLTKREAEVALHIKNGFTDMEICDEFFISPSTLSKHINRIYKKTNVNHRISLIKILNNNK